MRIAPALLFLSGTAAGIILAFCVYQLFNAEQRAKFTDSMIESSRNTRDFDTYGTLDVRESLSKPTRNDHSARILCMIITMPLNHPTKALAVKQTWAQRCDGYFFVSSKQDPNLPSLAAVKEEGRNSLWDKTIFGIRYALKNYAEPFDYFFKADDDTYVIMENLRKLLGSLDSNQSMLLGRRFKPFTDQGYTSGGGGYVLSRTALETIGAGLAPGYPCGDISSTWAEDVELGKCAAAVGVPLIDSLDAAGRERFHPLSLRDMMQVNPDDKKNWLVQYNYHPLGKGRACCSKESITFHYVGPDEMYAYDFLLYHLRGDQLG